MSQNQQIFKLQEMIRLWFAQHNFTEVSVPPMVENPGMERHLHPFQLYSPFEKKLRPLYLHTSPEFYMKQLLSEGMEKIFHLGFSFRDEPPSSTHRPQFLMLEWYRAHEHYLKIMEDVVELIRFCEDRLLECGVIRRASLPARPVIKTVAEVFEETHGLRLHELKGAKVVTMSL